MQTIHSILKFILPLMSLVVFFLNTATTVGNVLNVNR